MEVVSSLPSEGGRLSILDRAVGFDYPLLTPGSALADEVDGRVRNRPVNAEGLICPCRSTGACNDP